MTEIRAYRLLLNKSQKEFAEELGIGIRKLQRQEQGADPDEILLYVLHQKYQIFSREVVEMKMCEPGKGRVKRVLS